MRAPTSLALLTLLALPAPLLAQDDEAHTLDARFERVERVGKYRLLLLEGGGSYRMTERTFAAHERLWFFVEKGDKVHLTVKRGWVLSLEKGWKTKASLQSALVAELKRAREGDEVLINGQPYLFTSFADGAVKASPKLPGGDFGYAGEERIPLASIESFEPAPEVERAPVDLAPDMLQMFKVAAGDTVRLELAEGAALTGAVAGLSRTTCELLEWSNGVWGARRRVPRPQVQQVRHVWLDARQRVRLPDGELTVEVSRFRRATTGPLQLKVEVSHDMAGTVVRDLEVQLHLRSAVGGGPIAGVETLHVPPLLPGRPHRATHEVRLISALDVDVQLAEQRAIPFEAPDAREPLLQAIGSGADLREMTALYRGAGRAKDAGLVRLLVSRALYPPARNGESAADHAAIAVAGLREAGAVALDLLFEELDAADEALGLTSLREGQLAQDPLPHTVPPVEHRRALVGLLPQLPGGLEGARGRALFRLRGERTPLAPAIDRAFAAKPEVSTPLLLQLAVPPERGAPETLADAAAGVLKAIGRPAIEPLIEALQTAGADLTPVAEARARYEEDQPHRVVEAALEAARDRRAAVWKGQVRDRLDQAKELGEAGRLDQAIAVARDALAVDPAVAGGQEALADLLHDQAVDKEAEQLPGEAALLLEEAVPHRPASRAALARLILAGIQQDLGTVALRAQPHVAAAKIGTLLEGNRLPGEALDAEWVEVDSELGVAYVYAACLERRGDAFVVKQGWTPRVPIERAVERAKELDATRSRAADEALGTYYAIEAERLYEAGKHDQALEMFERAAALVPDDERLSLATSNWIQANLALLGLLTVVLAGGAVGLGVLARRARAETAARAAAAAGPKDTGALAINLFESDMGVTLEEEDGAPPPADDASG